MTLSKNNGKVTGRGSKYEPCFGTQIMPSIKNDTYIWKLKLFGNTEMIHIGLQDTYFKFNTRYSYKS